MCCYLRRQSQDCLRHRLKRRLEGRRPVSCRRRWAFHKRVGSRSRSKGSGSNADAFVAWTEKTPLGRSEAKAAPVGAAAAPLCSSHELAPILSRDAGTRSRTVVGRSPRAQGLRHGMQAAARCARSAVRRLPGVRSRRYRRRQVLAEIFALRKLLPLVAAVCLLVGCGGDAADGGVVCEPDSCVRGECRVREGVRSCECPPGYEGERCENETAVGACEPNPCENGGSCSERDGGYRCSCASGFSGSRCQTQTLSNACEPNPCENGGLCKL